MPIVGGLDIHRKQITFDYLDTVTGQVCRGQVSPADRAHLRAWLARFHGREDVAFAVEGCTGWRYVVEELAAAGIAAHLAEPTDTGDHQVPAAMPGHSTATTLVSGISVDARTADRGTGPGRHGRDAPAISATLNHDQ